jgi:diguanylate cyclase (GGDEF)-like protein/PAS domain S-box-containing protein
VDPYGLAKRGEDDGLWDWNLSTKRIHFSPRWISMLGCEQQEVGNAPEEWFRRIHPEDLKRVQSEIDAHLVGKTPAFESEHRLLHKEGTYRWMSCRGLVSRDEKGQPVHLAGFHSDITAEKVADALTGLPNRLLLLDRLARSIERAKRRNDFLFAVLLVDVDRFGSLVERLGSRTGDELLIAAARRLETSLRSGDTVARLGRDHVVARLGGDEFTILLDGLNEIGEARSVADRLLAEISAPFEIGGREVFATASIGIALSVSGYLRPEDALRDADIALHRAKSLGKARCEVFDTAVLTSAQTRLQLEADLQEALARQEFKVVYQPIVSLSSNQIAGFEALVRWNHPVRGTISPQDFIPVAERTGLVVPLGRWVLQEACRQVKAWQTQPGTREGLWVSVNFSCLQFKQPALAKQVSEILRDAQIEPRSLMLELTESAVMENPEAVSSLLMQLRVLGVKIALDDFGTGYSSLSYLRQFPVDFLKIDHSFVRRMETSKDLAEITRTIGSLAHQLGLRVIAEGIENEDQLTLIRSLNCEYGQGYLFSKPVDSGDAEALLKTGLPQRRWIEPVNEHCPDGNANSFQPSQGSLRSTTADPHLKWPWLGQVPVILGRRVGTALIVSVAAIVLLAGGAIVKYSGRTSTSPAGTTSPALQNTIQPAGAPASPKLPAGKTANPGVQTQSGGNAKRGPSQTAPKPSGIVQERKLPEHSGERTASQRATKTAEVNSAPPGASVKSPSAATAKPAVLSFSVVHDHVLGSCNGTLTISRDTISWLSEKRNDGFALKCSEFSYAASNDQLTIKSGSKTYRFKPKAAGNNEDPSSRLQSMLQGISSACPSPR